MVHVLMQVVVLVPFGACAPAAVHAGQVLPLDPAGHLAHGPLPLEVPLPVPVVVVRAGAGRSASTFPVGLGAAVGAPLALWAPLGTVVAVVEQPVRTWGWLRRFLPGACLGTDLLLSRGLRPSVVLRSSRLLTGLLRAIPEPLEQLLPLMDP